MIILICGLPASGKTTIGHQLAKEFQLPIISKDEIKESLFDSLGYSDREWSKRIGRSAYPIMFKFAEAELKAKRSFILESNFHPEFDTLVFKEFKEKYSCKIITINCHAKGDILFDRFKKRVEEGRRHPGHCDHQSLEEFREVLKAGKCEVLNVADKVFEIDTSDFEKVDLTELKEYLIQF